VSLTIGIIGAGQLGRYLCEAARKLGLRTIIMTDDPEAPAAPFADGIVDGGLDDLEGARQLVAACDVVTFEIEGVGLPVLEYLAGAAAAREVAVRPGAEILVTLRNKATQKQWLADQGLPTAPFRVFEGPEGLLAAVAAGELAYPFVQKAQVGGYDGRGVHILHGPDDLADLLPGPCMVEAFVEHVGEFGVLVARGLGGEISCYEPVALRFDPAQHVLDAALTPAGLTDGLRARSLELAAHTVERLQGIGLFAFELFLTPDDDLLINEISPRVHNSGHLTLEACATSQFEQHIRAIAGLELGPVTQRSPAVMRNLLWRAGPAAAAPVPAQVPGSSAAVYWYDKAEGRPWRKMGHLTALGATLADAEREADAGCRGVQTLTNGACW
jgi:5-(carboxyamino)imidazole ribonucleotide synthase